MIVDTIFFISSIYSRSGNRIGAAGPDADADGEKTNSV